MSLMMKSDLAFDVAFWCDDACIDRHGDTAASTDVRNRASQLLKPGRVRLIIRFDEASMSTLPLEVLVMLGQTIEKVVPITIVLALVFTLLTHFWACNPAAPWWRKREIVTDVVYWFFVPVFARVFRIGLGARRRRRVQHSRCRRVDRLLRQW